MAKLQFNSYREIFSNRNFLLFWSGFTLSSIGDSLTRVALTWFVFEQTKSAEMRGRTFALLRTLMQGATPLGDALAGFLLPVMGIPMIIALSSLVIGAPGLAGIQTGGLRQAGSETLS